MFVIFNAMDPWVFVTIFFSLLAMGLTYWRLSHLKLRFIDDHRVRSKPISETAKMGNAFWLMLALLLGENVLENLQKNQTSSQRSE